jgi:LPS export ABC transporter protein LptC
MGRTITWVAAILMAAALGAVAGVSWRGRQAAPPPGPAAAPQATPPASPQASPPASPPAEKPFLRIEGTTLSAADPAGRRLWDLRAAQLTMDNAQQRVVLTRVEGRFYSGGTVRLTFRAPNAVFHVRSRDVEMTGGVVGRSSDGRILRASRVRWSGGTRAIQAEGTVVLTQRGMAIHSDRLTADGALDQVKFSGNVSVQVTE